MENKKLKKYNIPIFIPHEGCPNACVFCNQKKITGIQTTVTCDDVRKIIESFLSYIPKGDANREIAFFGGSFTGLSLDLQEEFLKTAWEYRDFVDGVRLSTRPDKIDDDVLSLLKKYNVKTIELGLQSSDDEVLSLNGRGHTFSQTVKASKLIKSYDIDLGLQMMVGMYGSNPKKDIKTACDVQRLKPKCVRIYPTLVLKNTKLEELYCDKVYIPYDLDVAIDVTDKAMRIFEKDGIEVIRVGLHSDESLTEEGNIVAGPYHPAFRELVLSKRNRNIIEEKIKKDNLKDCELCLTVKKEEMSSVIGHKRCNARYFKENYNIDIRVRLKAR